VQSGYKIQPLSSYLKQPAPPAAPAIDFPKINKELAKTNFWEYLAFSLQFAPAGPDETELRAKLARLGVEAGKKCDGSALSPEQKAAVVAGMKAGEEKIKEFLKSGIAHVN